MTTGARSIPRGRPRLTRRAAGLAAIVLLLGTATVVPVREYIEQRSDVEALERQVRVLVRERRGLERRVERLRDPEYLEQMARECLGMVKPGEIGFVTVPRDGGELPGAC